ncbi:PAK3 kinase, partial [Erythrocercus mccallii]|nr:PAK3 kinase [Erythrocercus mccallii]
VAIKKIDLQEVSNKQEIIMEITVMMWHRSPCLVNYLDSYLVGDKLWIIMEYMNGGPLSSVIKEVHMAEGEMAAICQE